MRLSTFVVCLAPALFAGCSGCDNNHGGNNLPIPGVDTTRDAYVAAEDPYGETVKKVEYLRQNWSPSQSTRYYFTAQGSQIIPYDWFLHLEQAGSEKLFRDDQNILRYRYLPQKKGPLNDDALPVGFVGGEGAGGRKWFGFTCAACHTNEIHLGDTAYRVDGAPTQADAQAFLVDLVGAMKVTLADDAKFDRFAKKVLKDGSTGARDELKAELAKSIKIREGYNLRNFLGFDKAKTAPQPPTSFGRLDAVDSIVNEVFWATVKDQDLDHPTVVSLPGNALVSYPFLWDTPQHDKVEWLGIATNGKMGDSLEGTIGQFNGLPRNVGEVLGVFGDFEISDPPSILAGGYRSSVKISALTEIEALLTTLWSPEWPDAFPRIDQAAAAKGKALYERRSAPEIKDSCLDCHAVIDRKTLDRSKISIAANLTDVGSDRQAYINFFNRRRPSGRLEGVDANFVTEPKIEKNSLADPVLSNIVIGVIVGIWKSAPPDKLKDVQFGRQLPGATISGVEAIYKGRPLDGIWATAPYLHNGSVPTLDDLLKPVAERPKSFKIGSRKFDPVKVGFQTESGDFPTFEVQDKNGKTIPGHSNEGHTYGAKLSADERAQLLEYLKTL